MPDQMENMESPEEELVRLRREVKKLTRQMNATQSLIDRNRLATVAKANLGAIIAAERSKQEKYMSLLLENSPDIILLFDQFGRFAYCTDAFLKAMGLASFGLIDGRHYHEVFSRFDGEEWAPRLADGFNEALQEKRDVELRAIIDFSRQDMPRDYTIHITPMLDEKGAAEGALTLFHDQTDIARAKDQAEKANRAKSDFLATVSHEIRTPMNAIIGISDMIQQTELTAKQREYMENIQNSSAVLLNLINDILDFSKIEAGKLELTPAYFSLSGLLRQTQAIFETMFEQKGLGFICRFADDLPAVVYGDEKRIGRVLTNVLNNAFKYTGEGLVCLDVTREGENIRFAVRDSGIGIREEDLPRLFTAFEQLDQARNRHVVGTGLGLAITHRLCELMRGSIGVESTYGEGSCFTVVLPLEEGTQADLAETVRTSLRFSAPGARVLVVDDIEINLMVASAMLEFFDIRADQAASAAEALRMLRDSAYDLVFMDHMMPEMDGIEATQIIRKMEGEAAGVPIVALTANAVNGAIELFLSSGFNDFLSKPIDRDALADCLVKWLPESLVDNLRRVEG